MGREVVGRKIRVGTVTSDRMDKTVVVKVNRRVMHPRYKKVLTRGKSYTAHDPENTCRVGDTVKITETRPLSKRKRWRVLEVVRKAT